MGLNAGRRPAQPGSGKRQEFARWCHRVGAHALLQRVRAVSRTEVRVLAYHRVLDIGDASGFTFDPALVSASPERFREQMRFIRDRYHPISSTELIELIEAGRAPPRNAIVVTFDDGYDDNYRIAFPILRELGVPATFFVSTRHIDSGMPYSYDWFVHMICTTTASRLVVPELKLDTAVPPTLRERHALGAELLDRIKWLNDGVQNAIILRLAREWSMPPAPHPDCRPMRWDDLREMQSAGMDIGSHGVHHKMLALLPDEEMVFEIVESKAALDRELGVVPRTLSYPVGGANAYNPKVATVAREAGFQMAFSYISGSNRLPVADRFAMHRLPVEYETDIGWFAGIVAWPEIFSYPTRLRIG